MLCERRPHRESRGVTPSVLAGAAEATVVALAVSGDHPAFAELVRRRQGMVRGLMRRLCQDHALAEDLAINELASVSAVIVVVKR